MSVFLTTESIKNVEGVAQEVHIPRLAGFPNDLSEVKEVPNKLKESCSQVTIVENSEGDRFI